MMKFQQLLHNAQANARSIAVADVFAVNLVIPVPDILLLILGNAFAEVLNLDMGRIIIFLCPDDDTKTRPGIIDGIDDEVIEYLRNS